MAPSPPVTRASSSAVTSPGRASRCTAGRASSAARAAIQQAGFGVAVVYGQVEDKSKAGTVIRQDPPGGTPAAEGTRVTLVVGKKGGN